MKPYNIIDFYKVALEEEQGIGTAYEYLAKQALLERIFKQSHYPNSILVAGLPEKYGSSMDFVALADRLGITLYIDATPLTSKLPECDLAISCEFLQSISGENKIKYLQRLSHIANGVILFTPSAGNKAHTKLTGLKSISKKELKGIFAFTSFKIRKVGYTDIPPFPPGLTIKKRVESDGHIPLKVTAILKILSYWAKLEPLLPFKKRYAHIVYCWASKK